MPSGNSLILAYSWLAYASRECPILAYSWLGYATWECPYLVRIRDWHMPAGNNKSFRDWPINSLVGYAIHEWHMPFVNGRVLIREWDNSWVGQNIYLRVRYRMAINSH